MMILFDTRNVFLHQIKHHTVENYRYNINFQSCNANVSGSFYVNEIISLLAVDDVAHGAFCYGDTHCFQPHMINHDAIHIVEPNVGPASQFTIHRMTNSALPIMDT